MSDLSPEFETNPDDASDRRTKAETASSETTFEDGRYLYCAVALDESDAGPPQAGIDAEFPTGIEDEPVHLVSLADSPIGVLVHPCESLYDTDEMTRLHKWLLEHQRVIDAAGERFGTPLPFRFDTIVTGDDERVRQWVAETTDTLVPYLESFAGCWEYRIELIVDESNLEAELEADDDRLADLAARIEAASSGTGFLLEKQYEQRLAELKRTRRNERSAMLEQRLADHAREVHRSGERRSATASASGDTDTDVGTSADGETAGTANGDERTQARLTVLAEGDQEAAIGDVLDEIAAEPGVTVRFTGPWPPYSFAPEIDGDGGTR